MICLGLMALYLDFSEPAGSRPGRKRPTAPGGVAGILIVVIGVANLDISRISDLAGQRISEDATKTFNDRLHSALSDQAQKLLEQLTPTLVAQKSLILSTASDLQSSLQGTGKTIETDLQNGADKSAQNLMQVADILEYSNVPLEGFDIGLDIPDVRLHLNKEAAITNDLDDRAEKSFFAKLDQHCASAALDISPSGLSSSEEEPCKTERANIVFWRRNRPVHRFIDPNDHLDIRITVQFPDLNMTYESRACKGNELNELCSVRIASLSHSTRALGLDRNADFNPGYGFPEIVWRSNLQSDPIFQNPGLTVRDFAFPKLSVSVCKPAENKKGIQFTALSPTDFPTNSEIDIISVGFPTKTAIDSMHLQHRAFYQTYKFHLREIARDAIGCSLLSYSR